MQYSQHNYAVKLLKMMSNSNRLRVLEYLANKKEAVIVTKIANDLDIEISNLSNHLFKMREVGLVKAKQDSANMYYSIKDPKVGSILVVLAS